MDERFARYLLRELRWEVERHSLVLPDWEAILSERARVVAGNRYRTLRVWADVVEYDIHVSWRGDLPPTVARVGN